MARPTRRTIASGIAAWDADTDENFGLVFDTPYPIVEYALVGDLPAAGSYENCLALVGGDTLYISNGASWSAYQGTAAAVLDSTATTVSELAIDYNELIDALKTAGIMRTS
jgi:hypothetical protein